MGGEGGKTRVSNEPVREKSSKTYQRDGENEETKDAAFKVGQDTHTRTKTEQEVKQIATEHKVGKVQKSDRRRM